MTHYWMKKCSCAVWPGQIWGLDFEMPGVLAGLPTVEAYVTHQPTTPWKFEDGKARKASRKAS